MRLNKILAGISFAILLTIGFASKSQYFSTFAQSAQTAKTVGVAVGPQYDTTHVYVPAADFDRFVASVLQTFGGKTSQEGVFTVTPTPSSTRIQLVLTPVGTLSVFGFKTPIPYPFGLERTGYNDPIGQDAIIQWPGGVNTQLYWHTTAPSYAPLQTVPENRVYVSPDRVDAFVRGFVAFSQGSVVSDEPRAPGVEIGRPTETYRRVRIESRFGKLTALVTDGHLPYPFGREVMGYEVTNLTDTLTKAKASGVDVLVAPYKTDEREGVVVQFPGGYIAEIHSITNK